MKENKFRYVFKNIISNDISIYYFTLKEIEDGGLNKVLKSGMLENGYRLIARNVCSDLEDKNGKEIYEEDIVKVSVTYNGDHRIPEHNTEIIFEDGSFNVTSEAMFDVLAVNPNYWEIIGNNHENPELLKGAKKWMVIMEEEK